MIEILPPTVLFVFLGSVSYRLVKRVWHFEKREAVFVAAIVTRMLVAILITPFFLFDDELAFLNSGKIQLYGLISFHPERLYHNIVAFLYSLFGPNIWLGKIFNAFVGTLSAFLTYSLGQRTLSSKAGARVALLMVAFLPPTIIYSGLNLKEPITVSLFLLLLLVLIERDQWGRLHVIILTLLLPAIYWNRGLVWLAPALGALAVAILWPHRSFVYAYALSFSGAIAKHGHALFDGLAALLFTQRDAVYQLLRTEIFYFLHNLNAFSLPAEAIASSFLVPGSQLNPINLSILSLRALYSPSPLTPMFDLGYGDSIEAITTLTFYVLIPASAFGMLVWLRCLDGARASILTLVAVIALIAVVGDTARFRVVLLPLVSVLATEGFTRREDGLYKKITIVWWVSVLLFTALWLSLRLMRN